MSFKLYVGFEAISIALILVFASFQLALATVETPVGEQTISANGFATFPWLAPAILLILLSLVLAYLSPFFHSRVVLLIKALFSSTVLGLVMFSFDPAVYSVLGTESTRLTGIAGENAEALLISEIETSPGYYLLVAQLSFLTANLLISSIRGVHRYKQSSESKSKNAETRDLLEIWNEQQ